MTYYMCATCGTQHAATDEPPDDCIICNDDRQYVGANGQTWTTLEELRRDRKNVFTELEPGLTSIVTEPRFAIGQRAHLVQTPGGNILWDCISLIDNLTVAKIRSMGGVRAMAISHPHYYSAIVEWARVFGNIPIYIHEDDQQWVTRMDTTIQLWEGETLPLWDSVTLVRCGGHFDGSTVLHWSEGADQRGVLLTGDTIYVVTDQRYVSFMSSFPNLIPLPADKVSHIVDAVDPFEFERIYDAFGRIVSSNAKESVRYCADRYIRAIRGGA